jgi:hypothetical protein
VHEEREVVLPGELHVRVEHPELSFHRSAGGRTRTVEPALAHRHGATSAEKQVEPLQRRSIVRLGQLGEKLGVNAERDLKPRLAMGQLQQRVPGVRPDGRD